MLGYRHIQHNTMTIQPIKTENLTEQEWKEMVALKSAINYQPHSVAPHKMEMFTEYLVRSLKQKGG